MLLPLSEIETVFLDMDGTLLDLNFDNYFWLEYLPKKYGEIHGLSIEQSKKALSVQFAALQGQLQWYCIDYWSDVLSLPILKFKEEIAYLIKWRDHAEYFLKQLNDMGKRVILITNAHPKSLQLKIKHVNLTSWFQGIISSHEYGFPKESQQFWHCLQNDLGFCANRTLFVDDSIAVLNSAKKYGIKHLYAIYQPDSQQPPLLKPHDFTVIKEYIDCF